MSCARCAAERIRLRAPPLAGATSRTIMRRRTLLGLLTGAAATLSAARAGHEIPIYPSFYAHEIEIRTLDPGRAADALRSGEIQAYVGKGLELPSAATDNVR